MTKMIIKIGNLSFTVSDETKQQKIIDVICQQESDYSPTVNREVNFVNDPNNPGYSILPHWSPELDKELSKISKHDNGTQQAPYVNPQLEAIENAKHIFERNAQVNIIKSSFSNPRKKKDK